MTIIPLYIQKFIIKLLCKHIDRQNKTLEIITDLDSEYRKNESINKKLMLSLALVCKDWFKTLSNNLTVSVDFNYKDQSSTSNNEKYSIIKRENIKTIKLHHDYKKPYFYKIIGPGGGGGGSIRVPEGKKEITINEIDNRFENLIEYQKQLQQQKKQQQNENQLIINIPFKRVLIRNINIVDFKDNNIDDLIIFKFKENEIVKSNIQLLELEINQSSNLEDLEKLKKRVTKLFSLNIHSCKEPVINEAFRYWNHSLNQLFVSQTLRITEIFSKNASMLSNVKYLEIIDSAISLKDLTFLLSPLVFKDLHHLFVDICLRKLVYCLSDTQDKRSDCICNCLTSYSSINDTCKDQDSFNNDWLELKEMITNKNSNLTLESLFIGNSCTTYGASLLWSSEKFKKSFINNFTCFLSWISPLKKFSIHGGDNSIILFNIMEKLKNIIYFQSMVHQISGSEDDYKFKFNSFISKNKHIKQFKLLKLTVSNNVFSKNSLIDYKNF
ncbi:hypothetical protein ACTFIW_008042 [Dictyostelium discoideum]